MKGPIVIALTGEVDVSNVAATGELIEREAATGEAHVVLDLTSVEYLDSTGLSLLTRVQRRLNRTGRRLAVAVDPNGGPRRVFDVTGLVHMLEVYPSVEAASAELAEAPRIGR